MGALQDYIRQGQVNDYIQGATATKEPIPAGEYHVELFDAIFVVTPGDDVLEVEFRVAIGRPHAGRRLYKRYSFHGGSAPYTVEMCRAIGLDIAALDVTRLPPLDRDPARPGDRFKAPVPRGMILLAEVDHWTDNQGRTRHQVSRLVRVIKPAPTMGSLSLNGPAPRPDDGGDPDDSIPF